MDPRPSPEVPQADAAALDAVFPLPERGRAAAWLSVLLSWAAIAALAMAVAWPAVPGPGDPVEGEPGPSISMVDELGGRITLALCQAVDPKDRMAVIAMSGLGADAMPAVEFESEVDETGLPTLVVQEADQAAHARRRVAIDLAMAILVGEAVGGEEGLARLPEVAAAAAISTPEVDWSALRAAVEAGLEARRDGLEAPRPGDETRAMLAAQLGWFAEVLSMWEGDPALRKSFDASLGALVGWLLVALAWFLGFGLAGFALLLVLVVLAATRRMRPRVLPLGAAAGSGRAMPGPAWRLALLVGVPAGAASGWWLLGSVGAALAMALALAALAAAWPVSVSAESKRGGGPLGAIYAETFLIWLLLFIGLQIGVEALLGARSILESVLVMIASLSALAWPRIRGIPFAQVREEIGLTWGKRWWSPPFEGLATYAIALPMILIGVALSAALTALLGPGPPPSHPIQQEIAEADAGGILMLLVLAAVVVPPIEEIMFRGVLYRHLRETFGRAGTLLGFAAAALVSSLLFAALHPQGLGFVPILASLAVAFCVARELTGSVVPAIVAHGVSNAAVVALNVALFAV